MTVSASALLAQAGAAEMMAKMQGGAHQRKPLRTISGAYLFENPRYADDRGDYVNISTQMAVVEAGTAMSQQNVLRGFHCSPFPKVVGCLAGEMFDVLLDLRPQSPSFGKWESSILKKDGDFVFIPAGVAHGYLAVADNTLTLYFKGGVFDAAKEYNVNPYDPDVNVTWPVDAALHVISDKDKTLPSLKELCQAHPQLAATYKKVWYAPNKFEAYGEEEILAVTKCLRDGWLAPGPLTEQFQTVVARYFGKQYGIYVNSGSSANMIGLAVYEFAKGSEIITPACTFSTVLAPIEQLGFTPVFVDVELTTYVPKEEWILEKVTPKTAMIMIPNLIGSKINWKFMKAKLAEMNRSDVVLFEDSCDCMTHTPESDVSAISFYASHIITGGGMGGMIMFNDQKYVKRALMYRDWGRVGNNSEDMDERFKDRVDDIEYDGKFLYSVKGYNMKSCEMSAAFGLTQMSKLDVFTQKRRANIDRFVQNLKKADPPTQYVLPRDDYNELDWLAFPLQHPNRGGVIRFLEANDVQIRVTFAGNVTRHPAYRHHFAVYPNADRIMKDGFLLGAHHGLDLKDIDRVTDLLIEIDRKDRAA